MLIIPLKSGTRGDQIENAKYFESKGYGITLLESEMNNENFLSSYNKLLNLAPLMKSSNKHVFNNDNLENISSIILKYTKNI